MKTIPRPTIQIALSDIPRLRVFQLGDPVMMVGAEGAEEPWIVTAKDKATDTIDLEKAGDECSTS